VKIGKINVIINTISYLGMHRIVKLPDTGQNVISDIRYSIGYPRREFLRDGYPTGFRECLLKKKVYRNKDCNFATMNTFIF